MRFWVIIALAARLCPAISVGFRPKFPTQRSRENRSPNREFIRGSREIIE